MKKVFFLVGWLVYGVALSAQTVSTASVIFANCSTEFVTKSKYIGEFDLPCSYAGVTFTQSDFTGDQATSVVSAINHNGCDSITTIQVNIMRGVLRALPFSVGENRKVYFSKGNLKYQSGKLSFHYPQYVSFKNTYGSGNENRTANSPGIDLFAFGASGYKGISIYGTTAHAEDNIQASDYDWAWHNKILNGGNQSHLWYTLTETEWIYLLYQRAHALELRGAATIGGYVGMVILPDDWQGVEGISWLPTEANYTSNVYSSKQWSDMEKAGAIFLPATSYLSSGKVDYGSLQGLLYWGAGKANYALSADFHYTSTNKMYTTGMGSCCCAVRAVRDIPME